MDCVTTLAASGAGAFAGAMATATWKATVAGFGVLLRRWRDAAALLDLFAQTARGVEAAENRDRAREAARIEWEARLRQLLSADPVLAAGMRGLIHDSVRHLPPVERTWLQRIEVRSGRDTYLAQHQTITHSSR